MKSYTRLHFFFRCTHCEKLYYSDRIIKKKRCIKCNKMIDFEKAKKMKVRINPTDAPRLSQFLMNKKSPIEPEFMTADSLIKIKGGTYHGN